MRNYYGYTRVCQDCGVVMLGVACNRKRCDAYRDAWELERQRQRDHTTPLDPPPSTLEDDVKAAADAGLSYGKYKAMQLMSKEEDKHVRR